MIGGTVSHYKILEELGRGGMGVVYKAEDLKLKRTVALKFLPPGLTSDADAKRRFMQEAQAASALDHPHICTIYEIDETADGRLFIGMAYYGGATLKTMMERGPLELSAIYRIIRQVGEGLARAHEQGIIHRDVKPANIMITDRGEAKIVDFGLAKLAGRTKLTREGTTLGTIDYMSPEQARGEGIDHRTDIWSLGVMLYEMMTGQAPFKGAYDQAVIFSILNEDLEPVTSLRTGIPELADRIVRKSLMKNPAERYQGVAEMLEDLTLLEQHTAAVRLKEGASRSENIPSIAVLPFVNMSRDPENDYFGDGLAEELINALTQLEGLRVAARTSAFRFRGEAVDIRKVGRQLNVKTVLEGSIRSAGKRLRVTAQLINIDDGYHLWSERYDREMADIFTIQDEITEAIVKQLEVRLLQKPGEPLVKHYTENIEAYRLYLKGSYFWNNLTPEGYVKSAECYRKAIEIDPDLAPAYIGLAIWYQSQPYWGEMPPEKAFTQSRKLVKRALELDKDLASAHFLMAGIAITYERDWPKAERGFKRALELEPSSAMLRVNYSIMLLLQGMEREAIEQAEIALHLDPLSPIINNWANSVLMYTGRHQETIEKFKEVVALDPDYWQSHYYLGSAYLFNSELDDAAASILQAMELSGGAPITVMILACIYYRAGRADEADELLEQLKDRAKRTYLPPTFLAWVYYARGDEEEAYRYLEQAFQIRDPWLPFRMLLPESLRPEGPRFDALWKRIDLKDN